MYVLTSTYLNTSAGFPNFPCISSGARYLASPSMAFLKPWSSDTHRPKSPSLHVTPSKLRKMLSGLMSKWHRLLLWRWLRPCGWKRGQRERGKEREREGGRERERGRRELCIVISRHKNSQGEQTFSRSMSMPHIFLSDRWPWRSAYSDKLQ